MLAYVLALVIGLGSLAIYMAAFFFPEVHRKSDFLWSTVGLFYALVLWVCAGRITGGVLLGQVASVALLGWLGWETLNLRRERALPEERTQISPQVQEKIQGFSLTELVQKLQQQLSNRSKKKPSETKTPPTVTAATQQKTAPSQSTATVEPATPEVAETGDSIPTSATTTDATDSSNIVTIIDSRNTPTETAPEVATTTEAIASPTQGDEPAMDSAQMSETPELVQPNPPDPKLVEAAQNTPDEAAAAQPIEEIAPDAEQVPPAEPPGDGDPQMRQNPPEVDIVIEGVPIDPENPPKLS
ncbi:MAG: Ycf66 family protein [Cyanobacteriota bacterium]